MNTTRPWGSAEKQTWFKQQTIKRSYLQDVVTQIKKLNSAFEIVSYGALSIQPSLYPLYLVKSKNFDFEKKTILITGGVHGYETSGVHGAIAFMEREARNYSHSFNFLCTPCISPWAYETINRWNPRAIDPNRSFVLNSSSEECDFFLKALQPYISQIYAHFDLHETTDTDNTIFRPAKALRDAKPEDPWTEIPDGFYVVGDIDNPVPEFQRAIVASVKRVTHIAPADEDGRIIGENLAQEGVVNYPIKKLSLCAGFSNAKYTTTTEVYPDSPKVTDQICVDAQVAAIVGGLEYLLS
ncbi:MAG: M14 family metallocarboxypeptidase [Bdellovibrionaceae bacterium]|nr:M14 family metallocarboxypeptidase [Pseudobdellovibrionaceae bacterium]